MDNGTFGTGMVMDIEAGCVCMYFPLFSISLHAVRRAMVVACRFPRGDKPIFPPLSLNPVPNYMRVIPGLPYLLPPISAKEKSDIKKP